MATDVRLPELGEGIESGDVVSVLVAEGDQVEVNQPLVELETDKATVEVPSEIAGAIVKLHIAAGDTVAVGAILVSIDSSSAVESSEAAAAEKQPAPTRSPESSGQQRGAQVVAFPPTAVGMPTSSGALVPAAPSVRRFAREIGIDISRVAGSGPAGRVSVDDVKSWARQLNSGRASTTSPAAGLPDFSRFGPVETEKFSNVRRATARHMATAWNTIPHVTNEDRADITKTEAKRKRFAGRVQESGGKLTVTSIAIKVVVAALKRFPQFNASIDVAAEEIIYKQYYNIGIAVDTPRGLLVPVIRDADSKTLVQLSVELNQLAARARDAKLGLDDLAGGTFTITNLGGLGTTGFAPIVNFPEVAILGISRANIEARFLEGEFQPRLIMPLSLSYDHRLIDGADAARFLRWTAEAFEDPFVYMLET